MSSTSIYPHVPYFYIIQHIPSGRYYAGSKWGINCHPETFMTPDGYQTSSNVVRSLINRDGIDSIYIVQILTEIECGIDVLSYETIFLQTYVISEKLEWLNQHNNNGILTFGTPEFQQIILKKFGVNNVSVLEYIKTLKSATTMKNFGVANPSQSQIVKDTKSATFNSNYGHSHYMKSQKGKDAHKRSMIRDHGVDHNMKLPEVRQKRSDTLKTNYGVDHTFQSPEIRAKGNATNLVRYGVENYSQTKKSREESSARITGSSFWNDGISTFRVLIGDVVYPKWVEGFAPRKINTERNKTLSEHQLGSSYWNDGVTTKRVNDNQQPKEGWVRGFAPKIRS